MTFLEACTGELIHQIFKQACKAQDSVWRCKSYDWRNGSSNCADRGLVFASVEHF